MPSRILKRGVYRYRGSVLDPEVAGKRHQKLFKDDSKESYKAAVLWEDQTRRKLYRQMVEEDEPTDTEFLTVLDWAEAYLDYAKGFVKKTYDEKRFAFKRFLKHEEVDLEMPVEEIDTPMAYAHLKIQADNRSGYATNKDRKNLSAAWTWGAKYIREFPRGLINPFQATDPFPEVRSPRYVPPVEDFWKVYDVAEGQDKVMLLTFLHLAARRGEVFRLKVQDLDFSNDQVRLWTRKRKDGSYEYDWLPMTSELRSALETWLEKRLRQPTIDEEHIFVCLDQLPCCDEYYGKPFLKRQFLMRRLCKRAGVEAFGFHAIRHLTATVLYHNGYPISLVQRILRHKTATTTAKYLQRLGLGRKVREQLEAGLKRPAEIIPLPIKKASEGSIFEGIGQKVPGRVSGLY